MFSFTINTRKVAQHSSNFSSLNTVDVVVSVGLLLIGIASGVLPVAQVYKVIGLVLKHTGQHCCPRKPLSHVSKHESFPPALL